MNGRAASSVAAESGHGKRGTAKRRVVPTTWWMLATLVIGIFTVAIATRWGSAVYPDGVRYISIARQVIDEGTFTALSNDGGYEPVTRFPPLFPSLLALPHLVGIDPLDFARWLNAILFGLNALLVGLIVRSQTRGPRWLPLLAAALVLLSVDILELHSSVLSEPVYMTLLLLSLILLTRYVRTPSHRYARLASLAAAGCFLDRYVGIAAVATAALTTLITESTIKGKLRETSLTALVGCAPMALWFARAYVIEGDVAGRRLGSGSIGPSDAQAAVSTLWSWLIPFSTPGELVAVALIGIVVCVVVLIRQAHLDSEEVLTLLPGVIYIISHVTTLIVAKAFFATQALSLNSRHLAPVHVVLIALVISGGYFVTRSSRLKWTGAAALLLLSLYAVSVIVRTLTWTADSFVDGRGYQDRHWQASQLIQEIDDLPEDQVVYSNGPDAIYLLTGRLTQSLPNKYEPGSGARNVDFQDDIRAMRHRLRDEDGVIAYFDRIDWREYLPSVDQLEILTRSKSVRVMEDGVLLFH